MELDLLINFGRNRTWHDICELPLELAEVGSFQLWWRSGKSRFDAEPVAVVMPPLDLVHDGLLWRDLEHRLERFVLDDKAAVLPQRVSWFTVQTNDDFPNVSDDPILGQVLPYRLCGSIGAIVVATVHPSCFCVGALVFLCVYFFLLASSLALLWFCVVLFFGGAGFSKSVP